VTAAAPAEAVTGRDLVRSGWAYTDSRHPNKAYLNTTGDAPIGAWLDPKGKLHKSRAYFTFDLSAFKGKRILDASLSVRETRINDCSAPRTWEIWSTAKIGPDTSWDNPPREKAKIADFAGPACPTSFVGRNITAAVQDAVAHKQWTLTLELRVPKGSERDLRLGRAIRNDPVLYVTGNAAPRTPVDLQILGQPCGTDLVGISTIYPTVSAYLADADDSPEPVDGGPGDSLTATFALWPLDDPAARVEWPVEAGTSPTTVWGYPLPELLAEGRPYALAIRSSDGYVSSPWSAECHFVLDTQAPMTPPTVTSTDYPDESQLPNGAGGTGIPGTFTFSADGDIDVTGFIYSMDSMGTYVAADAPGGSATVSITPSSPGPMTLYVTGVDRAGNGSPQTYYRFAVRYTNPWIEDLSSDALYGDPHTLVFHPGVDNVVSYTYRLDEGAEQTVAAAADGTARVTVLPDLHGSVLTVRSTTASGQVSPDGWLYLAVNTTPIAESDEFPINESQGAPVDTQGTFTFRPRMHDVVEYVFQFNRGQFDEEPQQTIAADANGTAVVTFTPRHSGYNTLDVFSRTADGAESTVLSVYFYPASLAPTITSEEYPYFGTSGGPGVPGSFTFHPTAADVVSYDYTFNQEAEQSVAAAADGTATIDWTPRSVAAPWYGFTTLTVRSHSANGYVSEWAWYQFWLNPLAPELTAPSWGLVGQPLTFTVTAVMPGSVEFVYSFDPSGLESTVPVGPDGTATITWTPLEPPALFFNVRSRTADGIESGQAATAVTIYYPE
jgi:hypothetical protein